MRNGIAFGVCALGLASQAFAQSHSIGVELVLGHGVDESCLTEVSISSSEHFCISNGVSHRGAPFFIGDHEVLVYVEGYLPAGVGRTLASAGVHSIVALSKIEFRAFAKNKELFVMKIDLDDSPTTQQQFLGFSEDDVPVRVQEAKVDHDSLNSYLQVLVGEKDFAGSKGNVRIVERSSKLGRETARNIIADHFRSLGLTVRMQCYGPNGGQGCNVEGTLLGQQTDKPIVIGAHYDSVTTSAADDNASGTAAVMEIARIMAGKTYKKTIKFVAFDQEESGLVGSAAYAKDVSASASTMPALAFTMDMIGYDSDNDGKLHAIDCGRAESEPIAKVFWRESQRLGFDLSNASKCTNRTDHASFWNKKIPAIAVAENFFGGDANPCYHKSCDTISNMNLGYFQKITQASASTIEALASM